MQFKKQVRGGPCGDGEGTGRSTTETQLAIAEHYGSGTSRHLYADRQTLYFYEHVQIFGSHERRFIVNEHVAYY